MAYLDNTPQVDKLQRRLSGLAAKDLAKIDPLLLAELLEVSAADVELAARTSFNGRQEHEVRDGEGTAFLNLFRWPATKVLDVRVETPILGYTRIYLPDEIKLYRDQSQIQIYTYKMLAETVTGTRLMDSLNWGTIFPKIPQAVKVTYCYGFPQYDPAAGVTTYDGGTTVETGDHREPQEKTYLLQLQEAAICDAAASYLAQVAGLAVGLVTAVSFDGFSKTLNPQAYGPQVQALIERRDELMTRRRRPFFATAGR